LNAVEHYLSWPIEGRMEESVFWLNYSSRL